MAGIVSLVTDQEKKKLEKIIKAGSNFGKKEPNVCISVYKNRGGSHNNVKIWLYVDYNTMRVHDLYVTDYEYKLDPTVRERFTIINEDQQIQVYDSKAEVVKQRHLEEAIDIVDDGGADIIDTLDDEKEVSPEELAAYVDDTEDTEKEKKKKTTRKRKKAATEESSETEESPKSKKKVATEELEDLQAFLEADDVLSLPADYYDEDGELNF